MLHEHLYQLFFILNKSNGISLYDFLTRIVLANHSRAGTPIFAIQNS